MGMRLSDAALLLQGHVLGAEALLRLLEDVAHARGADTHEELDELRGGGPGRRGLSQAKDIR